MPSYNKILGRCLHDIRQTYHRTENWTQPQLCLFNIQPTTVQNKEAQSSQSRAWAQMCLITARWSIMRQWIFKEPPSLSGLKFNLLKLFLLEKLDLDLTQTPKKRSQFFRKWKQFREANFNGEEQEQIKTPFKYNFRDNHFSQTADYGQRAGGEVKGRRSM